MESSELANFEEIISKHKVIAGAITKYALSSQNRRYFKQFIASNDLDMHEAGTINERISEIVGFESIKSDKNKDKSQKRKVVHQPKEENKTEKFVQILFIYKKGDFSTVEKKFDDLELSTTQISKLFMEEGKISRDRVGKFLSSLEECEIKGDKTRIATKLESMLQDEETFQKYMDDFDLFLSDLKSEHIITKDEFFKSKRTKEDLRKHYPERSRKEIVPEGNEPVTLTEFNNAINGQVVDMVVGENKKGQATAVVLMAKGETDSNTRRLSDEELEKVKFEEIKTRSENQSVNETINTGQENSQVETEQFSQASKKTEGIQQNNLPEETIEGDKTEPEKRGLVEVVKDTVSYLYNSVKNAINKTKFLTAGSKEENAANSVVDNKRKESEVSTGNNNVVSIFDRIKSN